MLVSLTLTHQIISSHRFDDLHTRAGAVYYETQGTTPNQEFIIQWKDVEPLNGATSPGSFEIILHEATGNIEFQHDDVTFGDNFDADDLADNGDTATIGIENLDGTDGFEISFENDLIVDNSALLFVFPTNNPPVAVDDGTIGPVFPGSSINIDVLANDTDLDGDDLTIVSVTQPPFDPNGAGSVVIEFDDTITYTAPGNNNGFFDFTYTITDGHGGVDTGTVTVLVAAL